MDVHHADSEGVSMGITAVEYQKLNRVGFVKFLNDRKNKEHFKQKAVYAYSVAAEILKLTDQKPREDDVFGLLFTMIRLDDKTDKFISSQPRISADYWQKWFTYLVLDMFWKELSE